MAWHAGIGISPGLPKDLTFDKLAGIAPQPPKIMTAEQMMTALNRFAVAHNAALAARNKRANDGD